jgi:hypothetical protein
MSSVPDSLRWLFWDLDVEHVDLEEHCTAVLGRVLEDGRLCDVRLVLEIYGTRRIREFFRDGGQPLLSERTRCFWRAIFGAEEARPTRPDVRSPGAAPRID